MKKRINQNLMGIATLAIALTLILSFVIYYNVTTNLVMEDLRTQVHILTSSDDLWDEVVDNYDSTSDQLRITVIDEEGNVVYESDADAGKMENHMERPEIQRAIRDGEGQAVRKSNTVGALTYYYAEKMDNGDIIRVARDFGYIKNLLRYLIPEIMLVFAAIFSLCVLLGHITTKRFVEPIKALAKGNAISAVKLKRYPEIQPFIEKIDEQNKELKKSSKLRQEFTANVSHELKTPLTAISGYAELIESGIAAGEDSVRFSGEIRKNSERLLTLINDILRLSQLDSLDDSVNEDEIDMLEMVDLHELAVKTAEMLQIQAKKNRIAVNVKGSSVCLMSNRQMMDELIYNLTDNAIRYNNPGGKVTVTVGKAAERIFISVKDTGIGISKEDQERIFERFYRVDKSRSKQTGGTGLGLAIVKHIAMLHNAEIEVHSELRKGTEIKILFPE